MAHTLKSPGVSIEVKSNVVNPTPTGGTLAAVVGFAKKGKIGEPTLQLNLDSFIEEYGTTLSDNYYMGMFAKKYLPISNAYFYRVAKSADYESIEATMAPSLDMSSLTTPSFWLELADFPVPNNGIFYISIANSNYADIDALITALNNAMDGITLPDGSTKLSSYVVVEKDDSGTKLVFRSTNYRNIRMTIYESQNDNIAKTTGTGHIGIASGTSSVDVGNYRYAFVRIPVNEVAATSASISSTSVSVTDLNKISAFNKINLSIDGSSTNIYKTYMDVDITPTTGAAATWPTLSASLSAPSGGSNVVANDDFQVTLAGFYDFMSGDVDANVNKQHIITIDSGYTYTNLSGLVTALNNAAAAVTTSGSNTLADYIQFEIYDSDKIRIVNSTTGNRKNYGSQCSVTIADGTNGEISDLGYTTGTNDSATGTDTTYTLSGVAEKLSALVNEIKASASTGILTISSDRTGSTSYIRINEATTTTESATVNVLHFTDGQEATGSNTSNSGVFNIICKSPGTWGNDLKVRTYTSTNPVTGSTQYNLSVYENDVEVENWTNINWVDSNDDNFIKTKLQNSSYVDVDFGETLEYPNTDFDSVPTLPPPSSGTPNPDYWELANGDDGIPSSDTEKESLIVEALEEFSNKEAYEIDLLLAPGFSGNSVISKLQNVGEARKDLLVLPDPPFGLDWKDIINWWNGNYPTQGGSVALTSGTVDLTWGWQKDYDEDNSKYVDVPPSIYAAVAIARTERNSELWEAPAGYPNGVVNSVSSYTRPTAAQREYLNNDVDPACINPIIQSPSEGIMIYGQKVSLRQNKPENRINVARLVFYIKRNLAKIARQYQFKLNNGDLWARITNSFNTFLGNIQQRGGLGSYGVKCDSSINDTSSNVTYAKVFIQPVGIAERIFIDLTISESEISIL